MQNADEILEAIFEKNSIDTKLFISVYSLIVNTKGFKNNF